MMQGPYHTLKLFGIEVCWGGVIVLRHTLLIVLYTLVQFPLLCSLLIWFLYSGFLLIHNIISPYNDLNANIIDTLPHGTLMILSGINITRAVGDSSKSVPLVLTHFMLNIIDDIDHIFDLWLPSADISILFLLSLIYVIATVKSYCGRHVGGEDR